MRYVIWLICLFCCVKGLSAQEQPTDAADATQFFEKRIRPVLVEHCYECHSADSKQVRGGLFVDRPSGLLTGGDSGPSVVPGNIGESLIIDALRHESFEMPPKGKLSDSVIADFVTWIEAGAVDPRPDEPVKVAGHQIDIEAGRQFWSFQPLKTSDPPVVNDKAWPRDAVDQFILAKLEAAGLAPVEKSSRVELQRRLYFDLIGMPPTPDEVRAFLADTSDDSVERVVDDLLTSPHFGERWGRHWLDVARYSDSTGGGRSLLYGESWRYRNYVIDAFNNDKPFQEFIMEQIAGDLLVAQSVPQRREQITATAFLTLGPTNYELQDKKQLQMDVIDEQIDTTGRAFLGMTLGCARCHDHKFDPIPVQDYYALASIFRNTQTLIDGNVSTWVKRPLPLEEEEQRKVEEHQREAKELEQHVAALKQELDRLGKNSKNSFKPDGIVVDDDEAQHTGVWTESTSVKPFIGRGYRHASTPEDFAVYSSKLTPGKYELFIGYTPGANRCPNTLIIVDHAEGQSEVRIDQRIEPGFGYVSVGEFQFGEEAKVTISGVGKESGVVISDAILFAPAKEVGEDDEAAARLAAKEKRERVAAELAEAEEALKKHNKKSPQVPQLLSVQDYETIADWPLLIRGNLKNPAENVPRGFLAVAMTSEPPEFSPKSSGRMELAEWIASPENPLTARVYVNRVWSKLFGAGLVRTVDNFGTPGERPTHPELLDQLALDFIADGWSTKRLIRRLVLTHTYQLRADGAMHDSDPDNRLLASQNLRRLDAECLYDSLLTLSGELQDEPVENSVRAGTSSEYGYQFDVGTRAVYLPTFRNQLPALFEVFDFPNPNVSMGRRNTSTLSTQALFLMNSPFVQERTTHAAQKLLALELSDEQRIDELYLATLTRYPTPTERSLLLEFLDSEMQQGADAPSAWSRAVQAVVASVDFRYR
ncbi:MAG: DUF1549 domain-containing protein [Planctomycetaceae bacterium]|nr:DUF1549 domain-containing protein [Planctomycetaceae bacterium]